MWHNQYTWCVWVSMPWVCERLCVCLWQTESRDQKISQQMQWATSLVTLTPTSTPSFTDEAKFNNYPPLHTQTDADTHTHSIPVHCPTVHAAGDVSAFLDAFQWEEMVASMKSPCVLTDLTDSRADTVSHRSLVIHLSTDQTSDPQSDDFSGTRSSGPVVNCRARWRGAKCVTAMSSEPFTASMTMTFSRML